MMDLWENKKGSWVNTMAMLENNLEKLANSWDSWENNWGSLVNNLVKLENKREKLVNT